MKYRKCKRLNKRRLNEATYQHSEYKPSFQYQTNLRKKVSFASLGVTDTENLVDEGFSVQFLFLPLSDETSKFYKV